MAVAVLGWISPASAQLLGTAGSYGVLGSTTVTNTGPTVIMGDLGVTPGTALTGFLAVDGGPGLVTGAINQGNAPAAQARTDLTTAYLTLAGLASTANLSGQDLGGMTLLPGVYHFDTTAQLTGLLTLDAQGDANARFVFQIGTTLTTAVLSRVNLINVSLAQDCGPDNGLYWQIGSSATLGTGTAFAGNLLALSSITLNSGASIDYGRALARNGGVTLDSNRIDASNLDGGFCLPGEGGPVITPVPEAGTYGLIGSGVLLFAAWRRRAAARHPVSVG
jgi:type VI secretion system secreted protein VgrG